MKITYGDEDIVDRLDTIIDLLTVIIQQEQTMATDLTAIQAAVEEDTEVTSSAITLLNTLADELRAAATDPAAIAALADQINSNAQALADAVVANTPAAPEPTP